LLIAQFIMKAISKPWFAWAGARLSAALDGLNAALTETLFGLASVE